MPDITIRAAQPSAKFGATFSAYLARPQAAQAPAPRPALVLIQEIFGVNRVMRDLADGFAASGYLVACPDLFWRQEPGIQITDRSEAEWARAFALYKGFDAALGLADLIATLAHVRSIEGASGKVGCVGYCLGGNLAYQMACRSPVDASVGYYGVGIEGLLDLASGIKAPLLLHIAEKDQFCPPEAQSRIKAALGGHKLVTLHSYAGQDHAFARVGGQHWNQEAAEAANRRTAAFLKAHLG